MRLILRSLLVIAVAVPGLTLALTGIGYLWLRTSLPVTQGTMAVNGPNAPVDIARDSHGIPHIRAESQRDAYFALGFVHAQDRIWQMEIMRRRVSGRLAEMAGERLVPQDRAMRTLGLYRLARKTLSQLSKPVRAALDAYSEGVNAWLRSRSGALPPEFYVAGVRPEPWKPEDSLLWGRLLGVQLSVNRRTEVLRALLLRRLPAAKVAALWPPYPEDAPVTVPAPQQKSLLIPPPLQGRQGNEAVLPLLHLDRILPPPPSTSASNSWAVAGDRTKSGKPIIAGDPHLRFRAPNLWYLARVTAPGLTLSGATLPGVPFHVLGHNGAIGWTMTTTGADTQDLVIEKIDPENPRRYLASGGSRPFLTRTETISVKGAEPVSHTIRSTRNGPVISDLAGMAGGLLSGKTVIALRASVLALDDRTAEALYHLNRARNWRAFRKALRLFHSPVQNFIYGDIEGHIGFQMAGRVPIRKTGIGFSPVRGENAESDWNGFIPFDRLPTVLDPGSGFIVSANNRVIGPGYGYFIARDWNMPYRAQRIEEQLAASTTHDVAASRALQLDNMSLAARDLIPRLLAVVPKTNETALAIKRLGAWDGTVLRTKPEPLIFNAWMREAVKAIAADELGALFGAYRRIDPLFIRHVLEKDPSWCDDLTTTARETCGAVLSGALIRALAELRRRFGSDITSWRWGDAHIADFRNRALERLPLIGGFANISIATDGDDFTLNRGTSRLASRRAPFAHVHGATYRAIYDFADLDRSLFIHPTGQSGNPVSPHYRDLITLWRDGRYITIGDRPEGVVSRLRLVPKGR